MRDSSLLMPWTGRWIILRKVRRDRRRWMTAKAARRQARVIGEVPFNERAFT